MPAMKRLGKPDTGNPFVRFDEGRVWIRELTTSVGSIPPIQTRLLYLSRQATDGQRWPIPVRHDTGASFRLGATHR